MIRLCCCVQARVNTERTAEGALTRGCSVDFDAPRRCLTCPCHNGAYDARMGYVMFGPPRRPLDQIVLQMRAGGQIWAIGKSFGRDTEMIAKDLGGVN